MLLANMSQLNVDRLVNRLIAPDYQHTSATKRVVEHLIDPNVDVEHNPRPRSKRQPRTSDKQKRTV
jgi:hypothetical protein